MITSYVHIDYSDRQTSDARFVSPAAIVLLKGDIATG
jgi:hypothetical protein